MKNIFGIFKFYNPPFAGSCSFQRFKTVINILEAVKERGFKALLPTIAYTDTEFGNWKESGEQLECVLSKNYQDTDGGVVYSESDIKRFFNEFAIKEAEDVAKRFLHVNDS